MLTLEDIRDTFSSGTSGTGLTPSGNLLSLIVGSSIAIWVFVLVMVHLISTIILLRGSDYLVLDI